MAVCRTCGTRYTATRGNDDGYCSDDCAQVAADQPPPPSGPRPVVLWLRAMIALHHHQPPEAIQDDATQRPDHHR